jgi:hypothetical protein
MQLDRYQASILEFLFERLPIENDVGSLEFSLSGTFDGKYYAAYGAIEGAEDQAQVIFNLPRYSTSVFLALGRSKPRETARLLANLEDYERESSLSLGLGEAILTNGRPGENSEAPFAVILLRTATSLDCGRVPDRAEIAGKSTSFLLAVPLTEVEWDCRRQFGHDALMDMFQSEGKELFF